MAQNSISSSDSPLPILEVADSKITWNQMIAIPLNHLESSCLIAIINGVTASLFAPPLNLSSKCLNFGLCLVPGVLNSFPIAKNVLILSTHVITEERSKLRPYSLIFWSAVGLANSIFFWKYSDRLVQKLAKYLPKFEISSSSSNQISNDSSSSSENNNMSIQPVWLIYGLPCLFGAVGALTASKFAPQFQQGLESLFLGICNKLKSYRN